MSLAQGNPVPRPGCSTPPPNILQELPAINSSPLANYNGHTITTPPKRARKPVEPVVVPVKGKHGVAKRKRDALPLPDNDLPRPPPSPFFTFQMPPPSIAGRQIKRLRSTTPSSNNPFLVSLKQFPTVSLYASSSISKREDLEESLPSSDHLGAVILKLEEERVIDSEIDVDLATTLERSPIEDEDDIFSD